MAPSSVSASKRPAEYRPRRDAFVRDLEILRDAADHGLVSRRQLSALHGKPGEELRDRSDTNIAHRLRLLGGAGFLVHPGSTRTTRHITNQKDVFSLTAAGARHLAEHYAVATGKDDLDLPALDWWRLSKVRFPHVEHELRTNDVLVALRLAAARTGLGGRLSWTTYFDRQRPKLRIEIGEKEFVDPDAYFSLTLQDKAGRDVVLHHYVEIDQSGGVNTEKMLPRFRRYFTLLKGEHERAVRGEPTELGRFTRCLTVAATPARRDFLRALAAEASTHGGNGRGWKGFFFATLDDFPLHEPDRALNRIFRYPDGEETVSLLEPIVSLP